MKPITVEEMDRVLAAELIPDVGNPMQDVPKSRSMLAFRLAAHRMQGMEALYGAAGAMSRMVDGLARQRDDARAQATALRRLVHRLLEAIAAGGDALQDEKVAAWIELLKYTDAPTVAQVPVEMPWEGAVDAPGAGKEGGK